MSLTQGKWIVIALSCYGFLGTAGVAGACSFMFVRTINKETIKPAPDLPGAESYGDDNFGLVHYGRKNFGIFRWDDVVEWCQRERWNYLTGNKCETTADLEAYEPNKWAYNKKENFEAYAGVMLSDITNANKAEINSQENYEFWKPFYEDQSVDRKQYHVSALKKCIDRKDSENKCTLSDLKTYVRIDGAISKFKKWLFPETEEQKKERYKKFKTTEYIEHSNRMDDGGWYKYKNTYSF